MYSHDRSTYFRRLTLLSAASLLVWLPLTYVALFVASPPLYFTVIGPLATVAVLLATHYRASRVVSAIHRVDARALLVATHGPLGRRKAAVVPVLDVTSTEAIAGGAASAAKGRKGQGYWPISLAGHRRFFLIDKQGTVHDADTMRRVVGNQPELDTLNQKAQSARDRITGPPTLKGQRAR